MAGLYVNSDKKSSSYNVHKQFMLLRELLVLSQLTTIFINIENSFLLTPNKNDATQYTVKADQLP